MTKLYVAAILVAFFCTTALAAPFEENDTPPVTTADDENYRLPTNIMPQTYNIKLTPYLLASDGTKRFSFDGDVEIEINATVATKEIVLHAKNLVISKAEFWAKDTPLIKTELTNPLFNNITDKLTYTLTTDLVAKKLYVLHFIYVGSMDDDMHGFYRSNYTDANNNEKWIASTQFQTNHARRAFPSFDEPKFKANFTVTITRHQSMNAVANTPVKNKFVSGDLVTEEFEETPKMSTYIVAFIVSEFTERSNDNSTFGVIARPEYYTQSKYSFDVGQSLLSELGNYLNLNYYDMGVSKMHMAAIPDFSAGAMENWGLLTYRERSLLYLDDWTTLSAKQSIAAVIAHEQAHMWFGDLVTCDWWSYTWLNEGFARYFQYFGTAMVEKNWALDQQFVVDQIQSVMGMDATANTNPLSDNNTNSPSDLSRMFNSISYNKGASFIRMVKHAMSEDNFKKSLQEYLKEFQYQNTVPGDLFKHWKANWPANTLTYTDGLFKSFTEQVGYPVVSVKIADDKKSFTISQKRFLLKENDGSNSTLRYTIPITYTTDKTKNFDTTTPAFYFEQSETEHTTKVDSGFNWVILNIQETGYYRVNYDEKNWRAIYNALSSDKWGNIHELNRAQIVDDLLNLARADQVSYDLAFDVLEFLATEINYLPWTAAFNGFNFLAIHIPLGNEKTLFGQYTIELTEKSYKNLGFVEQTTDSALDIYNRAKVLAWSCKYGNEECINKAKNYFNNMATTAVPVNIRSVVYCNAMRYGNESDYDKLYNAYKTATVATEETLILNNLGCVKDTKLVEKFFEAILSSDVRRQDKSSALSTLYTENSENVTPVFDLVTKNVDRLADAMGGYSSVATVISNIASRFTEKSQQQSLKEFNASNKGKFGASAATLEAAEKTVEENFAWAATHTSIINSYLRKRASGATTNTIATLTLIVCAVVARLLH